MGLQGPPPGQQYPPPQPPAGGSAQEERTYAMLCHLAAFAGYIVPLVGSIVGPLVVWLLNKDQYPLVDDQGKESLNFQITMMIVGLIVGIVVGALTLIGIGCLLWPVIGLLGIAVLILIIMAAVQANQGVPYRYPVNIRFIK